MWMMRGAIFINGGEQPEEETRIPYNPAVAAAMKF
jgi:hypothetical protein